MGLLNLFCHVAYPGDISHIKLGASKDPTILNFDDCRDTLERRQPRYRSYWGAAT